MRPTIGALRGFAWLNEHAPSGSLLYMPPSQRHLANTVHGLWLRADIWLIAEDDSADGPVYVLHTTRLTEYGVVDVDRYCRARLQPVYTIVVDGGVILELFILSPEEWQKIPALRGIVGESRSPGDQTARLRQVKALAGLHLAQPCAFSARRDYKRPTIPR